MFSNQLPACIDLDEHKTTLLCAHFGDEEEVFASICIYYLKRIDACIRQIMPSYWISKSKSQTGFVIYDEKWEMRFLWHSHYYIEWRAVAMTFV